MPSRITITAFLLSALMSVSALAFHYRTEFLQSKARIAEVESNFEQYKIDNDIIRQLEFKIIEAIKDDQVKTANLRNAIDNNIAELLIKVESVERDSSAAGDTAIKALRLAKSSRQDYFSLINAIHYNQTIITGWQEYYCQEIAPKNKTEHLCPEDSLWRLPIKK